MMRAVNGMMGCDGSLRSQTAFRELSEMLLLLIVNETLHTNKTTELLQTRCKSAAESKIPSPPASSLPSLSLLSTHRLAASALARDRHMQPKQLSATLDDALTSPASPSTSLDVPLHFPAPPTFPVEILIRILSLATEGLEPLKRQQTRFNFIQVCRLWYNSTVEIVRSECVVNGSGKAKKLARALGAEDAKIDGQQIKSLVLLDEGEDGGPNRGARFAQLVAKTRSRSSFEYFSRKSFKVGPKDTELDNLLLSSLVGLSELRCLKRQSQRPFVLRDPATLQR